MSTVCAALHDRLRAFVDRRIYPAHTAFSAHVHGNSRWQPFPAMEALKAVARAQGLWNLWISRDLSKCLQNLLEGTTELIPAERKLLAGPGLSNVDYAHLAKVMGEVPWCSEVFNCRCLSTCFSYNRKRKWSKSPWRHNKLVTQKRPLFACQLAIAICSKIQ